MFRHEFENFRRAVVAVFDGLRAAQNRAPHAFGSTAMHRHRNPCASGGLHREFHFVQRECWMRSRQRPPPVIAVQLDPIGAVTDLVAHYTH